MTFLEAAIEILKREGKPLPIRRMAELAVQHNLLSVVGRDPEGTMNARLAEVLDKGTTHVDLQRIQPDLYGLRAYPPRPYPVPREGGEPEVVDTDAGEDDVPVSTAEAGAPTGRRRRRRGRGSAGNGAAATAPAEIAQPELALDANDAEAAADEEGTEFDVETDGASAAPLMVSTAGDEELTRSGEEREVRSEILGRRDDRGRHRRDQRPGRKDQPRRDAQPHAPRPAQPHRPAASPSSSSPSSSSSERKTLATDLVDLLRAQDGRPQHARAIAQEVERKKILDGRPQPEIVREVRMALYGELATRPARGLRSRVRALGGGNYGSAERKLDEELLVAERGLETALDRLSAATVSAVRRKLSRLSPFSFEQLGRLVAESLGVERPTLVKRGDGVAYFGGERTLGTVRSRVLIAIRPGEAELGRRAVGELRAGLDARGFDEGVLLSVGRLSGEAREELRAGRAVTVYDAEGFCQLLVERKLGVRTSYAPIAYLDPDFFAELNET